MPAIQILKVKVLLVHKEEEKNGLVCCEFEPGYFSSPWILAHEHTLTSNHRTVCGSRQSSNKKVKD
jgi:hypothetical protein